MHGIFELILALFRALECHVEGFLGRCGSFFGTKTEPNTTPKTDPNLEPILEPKMRQNRPPKMDPEMVPKRLLGELLASSRLSWAVLGPNQVFFESS